MTSKLHLHVLLKIALAVAIALAMLILFYFWSPDPLSSNDLVISDGRWTSADSGQSYKIVAGRDLAPQIPLNTPCCNGYYEFQIPDFKTVMAGRSQPALYLSAASCSTRLALNGVAMPLKSREYTSVGPVVPLIAEPDQYPMTVRIDTECPRLMTTGIWKRPLRIGEFLELVTFQSAERNFQITTPLVSGAIFAAIGFGFVAIYFLTDRRFSFYLDVGFGLLSWSVFLLFLSGLVRESNIWFGTALHLPVRILAACGSYFVVRAYLKVITDQEAPEAKNSRLVLIMYCLLAILCLYFNIKGEIQRASITTMIASVCAYLLIFRWPLQTLRLGSIGYIAFVVCLTTWFGAISDGIKLSAPDLGVPYPLPYFNRYTANLFMTTAVVLFFRQFVGLYRRLQDESLRAARSTATGRAVKMIAHDVRAPFSSLRMGLQLLSKARGDQSRIDDLLSRLGVHLDQNLDRVNRMLKDVMTFGGELRFERTRQSVRDIAEAVIEAVPRSDSQNISMEVAEGCSYIEVDRDKLLRALANIVENALQASSTGTVVTLKAVPTTSGRVAGVEFTIHNFGRPIHRENLHKIFTEFYTEGKVGGTGLGLAIAKEFVEGHGGTILCVSDEVRGTAFKIWVPVG